ncbi:ligase-associated DNA damage response endonuclease PdeM [Tepidamorphus sp. 3E244]|uniref:ligase-associated DNA damage response endonuclease PdeM n=1 Tax=Tepidamorphus sp. 3E244 TaxID=3385498 RepID=UPI0038FCCEEC
MTIAALDRRAAAGEQAPAVLELCGEALHVDTSGAVWWPAQRMLIVADLHFEKGASLASRGVLVPPYDTLTTLTALAGVMARYRPTSVIALGDSFHDDRVSANLPKVLRDKLCELVDGTRWIWVAGNHDPSPPEGVGGEFIEDVTLGPLTFRHEPKAGASWGEVAGHLHPAASVSVRGRRLRRRCAASDGERVILPAFGAYTGGLNLRERAFDNLFNRETLAAWMLGNRAVYRVSGKRLGYGR